VEEQPVPGPCVQRLVVHGLPSWRRTQALFNAHASRVGNGWATSWLTSKEDGCPLYGMGSEKASGCLKAKRH
jgi:hypothetical protein